MTIEKTSPDKEKARSLYKMAVATFSMANTVDRHKFPSNVLKEYYELIRQLIDITLLVKGFKARGESAHEETIMMAYQQGTLTVKEHLLANELRKMRNRIAYEGFFVDYDYLNRKEKDVIALIEKLIKMAEAELSR